MRKNGVICIIIFILIFSCLLAVETNEEDEFWKMAELADQADRVSFRECIGKARQAALDWSFNEAELYLKEGKKYVVDIKKDRDELDNLKKFIDQQKKEKYDYDKKQSGEESLLEEGEVIVKGIDDLISVNEVSNENKTEKLYNQVPVYFWKKTLSGDTKYVVRYKEMFFIFSYDNIKDTYWTGTGEIKYYKSFIDVMGVACQEVNFLGDIKECVESDESNVYE